MKKRLIFALYINDRKKQFEIEDKTNELMLEELNAVIGWMSSFVHNLYHIHAERHNKEVLNKRAIN